jgi:phage-related protein
MSEPPKLSVFFYSTPSGREPVREWLKEQSEGDKKVIGIDIKTVQFGWPLGYPVVEKLAADLWEIRISLSQGIARVIFTILENKMVLLHAFIKKSQKIPHDDLELALRRCRECRS